MLKKAKILEEMGELARAIDLLRGSVPDVQGAGDPRLIAYSRHNLLFCLIQAGRYEEAAGLLAEVRELLGALGEPLSLMRLRWAEAGVAFGRGDLAAAERAFREVQGAFMQHGMAYDAALVSLELALLFLRQGNLSALKRLAADLVVLFEAREVHREALASLFLFQKACDEERLTEQLVGRLADRLRRERSVREA